jgi:hypothetical protein
LVRFTETYVVWPAGSEVGCVFSAAPESSVKVICPTCTGEEVLLEEQPETAARAASSPSAAPAARSGRITDTLFKMLKRIKVFMVPFCS